jgi:hypothetical protein
MVDRASTFADDETLALLKKNYVAYAPPLTEILKSRDAVGDFFRKVVNQRPEPRHTKQGYYICSPDGKLLKGWMYPRPDDGTMKRYLKEVAEKYESPKEIEPLDKSRVDRYANPLPPEGGMVLEVSAKLLEAKWQPTNLERFQIIRGAIGRDRLWVTRAEVQELLKGSVPDSLLERMIRFHLVDNTRGVPSMWQSGDLKSLHLTTTSEGGKIGLAGDLNLEEAGNRRYEAKLKGSIEAKENAVTRFDVVVRGIYHIQKIGLGEIPIGASTLAVAFTIAEPGEHSRVAPLYTWMQGEYMKPSGPRVSELRRTATR